MHPEGWTACILGDLIDIKHGYAFEGKYFRDEPPGDILLTPGNFMAGGGFQDRKLKYYAGPVPEDFVLHHDDFLVTMTDLSKNGDTLGYPARVPASSHVRYLHNQRLGKVLIRSEAACKIDSGYLYFLLCTQDYRHEVLASATGTTVRHTSPGRIRRFHFYLPPLAEQQAIARILRALDDKIELNRRMNVTLESTARTLFKSWFVDFDAVHAKAEGRQPVGMDTETAALFPDRLAETETGLIPLGWHLAKMGTLLSISREGLNPGNWPDEVFDHYSIPAYDGERLPIKESGASIKSNKSMVTKDCVLVSKLNPHIPRIWLPAISEQRRSVCSTEFLVTRPLGAASRTYLYALLSSQAFLDIFGTLVTGTSNSHQRVQPESLLNLEVVMPTSELIARFTRLTQPLYKRASHNLQESQTLSEVRDTLLPKLLSGEVRVTEAEQLVEVAL